MVYKIFPGGGGRGGGVNHILVVAFFCLNNLV